jgi:hypothetical protein
VSEDKHVEQAGEGLGDDEFAEQVAEQTSSARKPEVLSNTVEPGFGQDRRARLTAMVEIPRV